MTHICAIEPIHFVSVYQFLVFIIGSVYNHHICCDIFHYVFIEVCIELNITIFVCLVGLYTYSKSNYVSYILVSCHQIQYQDLTRMIYMSCICVKVLFVIFQSRYTNTRQITYQDVFQHYFTFLLVLFCCARLQSL